MGEVFLAKDSQSLQWSIKTWTKWLSVINEVKEKMDANCGFGGRSDEGSKGIFFSKQPDPALGNSVDYSVKLDPSVILLTFDGKLFLSF